MTSAALVHELIPVPDVMASLAALADQPGVLLLDSALTRPGVGRYSFLAAAPFETWQIDKPEYGANPFDEIREACTRFPVETIPGLPPFQGGAAGVLSYELAGCFEEVPTAKHDEFQFPALAVGLYDWVIAWDHAENRAWVISHGFREPAGPARIERARERLDWILVRLMRAEKSSASEKSPRASARLSGILPVVKTLALSDLAPAFPAPSTADLLSDFSRDDYLRAVERVIEYIHAGDIFQANLSQRLLFPLRESPLDIYAKLRRRNPAPFSAYLRWDDWCLASASPERFVQVSGRDVETRPIKGTRRRPDAPEADLYTRDELRESQKDQAENVMIVDLLRNDLSRVCEPGSIHVPRLCDVETYETVQHLVSEIRGRLRDDRDGWDLLAATFPGGSITGAPKIRAMEVIAELEPTVRGPYCGSLFYMGFDGALDSSILIRTLLCRRGWIQCPVGGGIVADSDPELEYAETLHKAAGMLRALEGGGE